MGDPHQYPSAPAEGSAIAYLECLLVYSIYACIYLVTFLGRGYSELAAANLRQPLLQLQWSDLSFRSVSNVELQIALVAPNGGDLVHLVTTALLALILPCIER